MKLWDLTLLVLFQPPILFWAVIFLIAFVGWVAEQIKEWWRMRQ